MPVGKNFAVQLCDIDGDTDKKNARLCIEGEVDVSSAPELRTLVHETLENAQVKSMDVDLSSCNYIDSTGIGVFVGAAARARELEKSFSVVSLQPNVARIFEMLDLVEELNIH